jgi:FdhD protein
MALDGKKEVTIQFLAESNPPVERQDAVAVEEPLEIRLGDTPVAVVMRTPGHDMELAVGFLFSEGILNDPDQVLSVAYCTDVEKEAAGNIVRVLAEGADPKALEAARREVYASSSCGLCGKTTLDAVRLLTPEIVPMRSLSRSVLAHLPDRLLAHQDLFDATGGIHAAGLCDSEGNVLLVREDIGRHNACDKVIGARVLREQWPLHNHILVLSGRASFEMVQKAAMAGIGAVVAVSAPSSLAIEIAEDLGITLVGFVRRGTMNLYAGEVVP